tara:strand:+ start:1539 stop:1694 length:156 start_codon:yes stop_codon:yes gene_type:complete
MNLEVGVLLLSATLPIGTKTLVSGKYVAQHFGGIEYLTTLNFSANLSSPLK